MKSKLGRILVGSVYTVCVAGLLIVLAELGVRAFGLGERPDPLASHEAMEAYADFDWREDYFRDAKRASYGYAYDYEPFSLWKHRDFESKTFNIKDGYRVTWEPESVAAKKDFTIYAFGGSTLFGGEGPDEHTVASQLAKNLNRRGDDVNYVVRNYGVSGFTSDNEVHLLVRLLRDGHRPDAVVFYDGVNDVYYKAYFDQPHYLYDSFRQFGAVRSRDLLGRLAGRLRLVSLLKSDPRKIGVRDRTALKEKLPAVLDDYFGNVHLVRALAQSYGFEAHFFWQPTLFGTGKKLTAEEQGLRQTYERFAPPFEVADAAFNARSEGREIHDLRYVLDGVEASIFVDFCHVTAIANEVIADEIVVAATLAPSRRPSSEVPPQGAR